MLYTIKVFYVSNNTVMLPNDKEKSVTISNNPSDAHTTGACSVTRRNLTRGALWAVPAIAASTAVPAFAASADDCKTVKGPDFTQLDDYQPRQWRPAVADQEQARDCAGDRSGVVVHGECNLPDPRNDPPHVCVRGDSRPRG